MLDSNQEVDRNKMSEIIVFKSCLHRGSNIDFKRMRLMKQMSILLLYSKRRVWWRTVADRPQFFVLSKNETFFPLYGHFSGMKSLVSNEIPSKLVIFTFTVPFNPPEREKEFFHGNRDGEHRVSVLVLQCNKKIIITKKLLIKQILMSVRVPSISKKGKTDFFVGQFLVTHLFYKVLSLFSA